MASKAIQTLKTLVADTFPKNSPEAKAFADFFDDDGLNINAIEDKANASIVAKASNWARLGEKVAEQWNRR